MKMPVIVEVSSLQRDEDGREEHSVGRHAGVWYDRGEHQFLVYEDDSGVSTTLRVQEGDWRLTRRGGGLESWQRFQRGRDHESQLSLEGSVLPLTTRTWNLEAAVGPQGGKLDLAYSLYSGQEYLGEFVLVLRLSLDPGRSDT